MTSSYLENMEAIDFLCNNETHSLTVIALPDKMVEWVKLMFLICLESTQHVASIQNSLNNLQLNI